MSETHDDTQTTNVIDLMAERILQHYEFAECEVEAELALALHAMYVAGEVTVDLHAGSLVFQLADGPLDEAPLDSV